MRKIPYTYTFTVTDVIRSDYAYNAGANVEASDTYRVSKDKRESNS